MSTGFEYYTMVVYYAGGYALWLPVCRCWVEQANTAGYIWCPYHGYVKNEAV